MGRVREGNPNLSLTPYLPRPAPAGLSFSPRQSRSFRSSAEAFAILSLLQFVFDALTLREACQPCALHR